MGRKPGPARALTIDVIARAVLDDGIATFSMPSVARRLGVAHSSLYRYFTDRDELVVQALDMAYLSTTWPSDDLAWEELLREISDGMWRTFETYPGVDRATQMAHRPPPVLRSMMGPWVAALDAQGFRVEDAAVAVDLVISLALSSSVQMAHMRRMGRANTMQSEMPMKAFDTDEVWTGRGLYGRKLDIFLAGLATRRHQNALR